MRRVVLGCVLALASTASADAPDAKTLRAEGEAHAKRGEYAAAIESFKAADRVQPQAQFACMIGLTYLRRDLIAQAELFLGRCHKRARPGEALPDWVPDADAQLEKALKTAKVSTVAIRVTPATAPVTTTISGFAPDESFDPQTIHLPAGTYTISVSAAGYANQAQTISVSGKHDEQQVTFALEAAHREPDRPPPVPPRRPEVPREEHVPPPIEPAVITPDTPKRSRAGLALVVTGGVLGVGGGVLHLLAWHERDEMSKSFESWHSHESAFDGYRWSAIGAYSLAAVALGAGLYLTLRTPESSTSITAIPVQGGGMVTVGWQR